MISICLHFRGQNSRTTLNAAATPMDVPKLTIALRDAPGAFLVATAGKSMRRRRRLPFAKTKGGASHCRDGPERARRLRIGCEADVGFSGAEITISLHEVRWKLRTAASRERHARRTNWRIASHNPRPLAPFLWPVPPLAKTGAGGAGDKRERTDGCVDVPSQPVSSGDGGGTGCVTRGLELVARLALFCVCARQKCAHNRPPKKAALRAGASRRACPMPH